MNKEMKTILCFIPACLLAVMAVANPNRYVWRTFGGVNVNLQPLFTWWTYASKGVGQPLDITVVDSNTLVTISNLWSRLPPRPLPEWFRITAREDGIAVAGSMWKVDAIIEPAPNMSKHQMIYLQDPPVMEIEDFKQARAAYLGLQQAQNRDVAMETMMESNVTAQADAVRTNFSLYTASGSPVLIAQEYNLQVASELAISNLNSAHARTQDRDSQMAPFGNYLSNFPDTNVYWLDHFALRTGRTVDGLEVYDMGIAQGLTY